MNQPTRTSDRGLHRAGTDAVAALDLPARVAGRLDDSEADAFLARVHRHGPEAYVALSRLYADRYDVDGLLSWLLDVGLDATAQRSLALRHLDRRREADPEWFLRERMLGYVCYADRFAGDLRGVSDRLDYLAELGITYLHLMPLLAAREGDNDGGYAVTDFQAVDARLGTMADLEQLATELRRRGIALCVDLVVNHTAAEHEWARRAAAGDPRYREYYLTFADRAEPDAFAASLPEIFPDTAPGNFTWSEELAAWVWTTFHPFQWDLNYANPAVFTEMLQVMLTLANRGVDVLRLDAVPFTWKRKGTDCQNQPEAHWLLQAWRALAHIAAPAVAFKAEAIVPPGELVQYLGAHERHVPECDLAYHNQLMVMGWSAVASRDARLPRAALSRMRSPPPGTGWVTYVRCHDDIGWAIDDADATAAGVDGHGHRRFLADFYAGRFPGSFARGALYQENWQTGDARTVGMTAALCGITQARELDDAEMLDHAVRRHLLLHAIAFGWGGIPLLWMGDEIALDNHETWHEDPGAREDIRWLHRPPMDWQAAGRRHDPHTVEGRVFAGVRALAEARRRTPELHAVGPTTPVTVDDEHVLAWRRDHPRLGTLLGLANVDDHDRSVDATALAHVSREGVADVLDPAFPPRRPGDGRVPVARLSARWLVAV